MHRRNEAMILIGLAVYLVAMVLLVPADTLPGMVQEYRADIMRDILVPFALWLHEWLFPYEHEYWQGPPAPPCWPDC